MSVATTNQAKVIPLFSRRADYPENASVLEGEFLTHTEVARAFGKTEITIFNWRGSRNLPYLVLPGFLKDAVRYDVTAVEQWARENKIPFNVDEVRSKK